MNINISIFSFRCKKLIKMPVPMELIVVIVGTGISYAFNFEKKFGVGVVGPIPTGIPSPELPPPSLFLSVSSDAFAIAIVAFTISVSMSKIFAKKHNYEIDSNQELLASGAANIVTSCFSGFMSSASLSRSLVQEAVGGKTQVASLVSCSIILFVLLLIGPLFECLPNSVLASIILVALKGMFLKYAEVPKLWNLSKPDFLIWIVTWSSTVFLDVDYGLVIGVGFSLLTIIWHTQRPRMTVIGQFPNSDIYKDVTIYQAVKELPGMKIVRFESALYFANAEFFRNRVSSLSSVDPVSVKRLRAKKQKHFSRIASQESLERSVGDNSPRLGMDNPALQLDELEVRTNRNRQSIFAMIKHKNKLFSFAFYILVSGHSLYWPTGQGLVQIPMI